MASENPPSSRRRAAARGQTPPTRRSPVWVPILVLAIGLFATAALSEAARRVIHSARVASFDDIVERTLDAVEARTYEHRARASAAGAVLGATDKIAPAQLERLLAALSAERPQPLLSAWCSRERFALPGAAPAQPPSGAEATAYCPIVQSTSKLLSPRGRAGFDLGTLPEIREAMERAASGGITTAASGSLLEREEVDVAFVYPVFGALPDAPTEQQRRSALRGFIVTAFSARQLLHDVLLDGSDQVAVSIKDRGGIEPVVLTRPEQPEPSRSALSTTRTLDVGGRPWELELRSLPALETTGGEGLVRLMAVAGFLVTLLLTALTWSEARARARAVKVSRRLAESELELTKANRAKDEFLAMLGHELRNPLGAISNALKVIRMRHPEDPTVSRALGIAERQAAHQARLVDDLLDLTLLDTGRVRMRFERLDLVQLARRTAASMRDAALERGHELSLVLPAGAVIVAADPTRLAQVLDNLLSNAIKNTPDGGHISIAVDADEPAGRAVVSVRDDGVGIEPVMLETVFAPFFQARATSGALPRGGLGIGLSIVRRLVMAHDGTVTAKSAGPGRGSEFVVRLPLLHADTRVRDSRPSTVSVTPPETPRQPDADQQSVLVVEDMADSREMLVELLGMLGHRVEAVEDGEAGVDKILESRPDVALVDLGLPGIDGLEVARRVRASPAGSHVRLVALTGFGAPEDRTRAHEAGFDDFLTKPLGMPELVRVMSQPAREPKPSEVSFVAHA